MRTSCTTHLWDHPTDGGADDWGGRPLTFVKYNHEGDWLFTCAKDHHPTVWNGETGERIGTYAGHNGAVWSCDVTRTPLSPPSRRSRRYLEGYEGRGSEDDAQDASTLNHSRP
jgi:WD40 repeat protein